MGRGDGVRLAFLGTPEPAVPFLEALHAARHDVVLVVTQPDRPRGRSGAVLPTPVKQAALGLALPVEQPTRTRGPEFARRLRDSGAELLVVVAYGRILPPAVLQAAPRGAVNVHFSLLPRWRGAAPVQWCLVAGDERTGVSTMQLDEGLDTGPVLLSISTPVERDEHAPALTSRLVTLGVPLLLETIERLGILVPEPQNGALATPAPLLSRSDAEVDPGMTAREIEGRVRGFDPWPGVWMRKHATRVRIVRAATRPVEPPAVPSGTILGLDQGELLLVCGSGTVLGIREVQIEGRRPVAAHDALNGRLLAPGDVLERL